MIRFLHGRYPSIEYWREHHSTPQPTGHLKVSVVVLSQGADDKIISEETRTITVNAHGAMIVLTAKVSVGQLLTLRNAKSGEEVLCRVAYVNPHLGEKKEVGIDFMKPCPKFWRITDAPRMRFTRD